MKRLRKPHRKRPKNAPPKSTPDSDQSRTKSKSQFHGDKPESPRQELPRQERQRRRTQMRRRGHQQQRLLRLPIRRRQRRELPQRRRTQMRHRELHQRLRPQVAIPMLRGWCPLSCRWRPCKLMSLARRRGPRLRSRRRKTRIRIQNSATTKRSIFLISTACRSRSNRFHWMGSPTAGFCRRNALTCGSRRRGIRRRHRRA